MGYSYANGYDIAPAPDGMRPERENYRQVLLVGRLMAEQLRVSEAMVAAMGNMP